MKYDEVIQWIGHNPWLFVGIIFIAVMSLYFSRPGFHRAFRKSALLLAASLRLQSRTLVSLVNQMKSRNRIVLMEIGRVQEERNIQREFYRVNAIVDRDLSAYPELQKSISDQITIIEDDYQQSGEAPPSSPDWVEAVAAIASLEEAQKGNPVIGKILTDLHASIIIEHKKSLALYRQSVAKRHQLLNVMMPQWRKLNNVVESVGETIQGVVMHSARIDNHMNSYEQIRQGSDKAERVLKASALTQFFISLFVVGIAAGGAFINFQLIALPMSEMVAGASDRFSFLGAVFTVSEVAALVIILVEMSLGLFLMEALSITRLFPVISSLDDRLRRNLIWILFIFLFILASVESGLAFMRDQIAGDNVALRQSLLGSSAPQAGGENISKIIPMVAQMVLGFILPFALMFVAVPLESLINSGRIVIADVVVQVLHFVAVVLRILSSAIRNLAEFIVAVYDIFIFLPLWIESRFRHNEDFPADSGTGYNSLKSRLSKMKPGKFSEISRGRDSAAD
jgi:hypothetical protein